MRIFTALLTVLAVACREKQAPGPPLGFQTRAPVGFVGLWVQTWPDRLRGDTLTLYSNFAASGLVPRYPFDSLVATATRWKIRFTSHDPVVTRGDWDLHRDDGGDPSCVFGDGTDSSCVSAPLLCIGDSLSYYCAMFRFSRNSLTLGSGARFVRASPPGDAESSAGIPPGHQPPMTRH